MKPFFSHQQLETQLVKYQQTAGTPAGRQQILQRLESTLRKVPFGSVMVDRAKLMGEYLRDPHEPWGPKALIGAALLYLVVPTDLVPDIVPLLGFTDDAAAITIVWNRLSDVFANYEERRRQRMPAVEG